METTCSRDDKVPSVPLTELSRFTVYLAVELGSTEKIDRGLTDAEINEIDIRVSEEVATAAGKVESWCEAEGLASSFVIKFRLPRMGCLIVESDQPSVDKVAAHFPEVIRHASADFQMDELQVPRQTDW